VPTIKGAASFQGIALIDTDVYIPDGNGTEWYINQNQFFRQIRNFNLDLTDMPDENQSGDQTYVPTGIHWQVAQATSLQSISITMTQGSAAVGVFTENGSGTSTTLRAGPSLSLLLGPYVLLLRWIYE
jgi:hypothetical protein